MRIAVIIAVAAAGVSTPALATGGFECRPVSGSGPVLSLAIGHTISARPLSVTIREGRRTFSTSGQGDRLMLGQSWIDGQYLWLDLIDSQAMRYEAKLRARFEPRQRGRPALGTLTRGGRSWRVRCVEA